MSEKEEYMEMIGITPTSSITYKKIKRKRPSKAKDLKREVIEKINGDVGGDNEENKSSENSLSENGTSSVRTIEKSVKKHKLSAIKIEVAVLAILVVSIFVANALMPNGGISSFVSGIIGQGEKADNRIYSDFSPTVGDSIVEGGIIKLKANKSVYAPVEGKVDSVVNNGTGYTITISHSNNFSSTISGLRFVYFNEGDKVVNNIPVGYTADDNAEMCFYGIDGVAIVNFTLDGSSVVWKL